MATDKQDEPVELVAGTFVRGWFLGRRPARQFDLRDRPGEKGTEMAKIGIGNGSGVEYEISVGTDQDLADMTAGWIKGEWVEVEFEPRPPFGSRGAVRFVRKGLTDRAWL